MKALDLIKQSDDRVGIEVEIEKAKVGPTSKIWHAKEDGSLRDGIEFVLQKPLAGQKLLDSIDELYKTYLDSQTNQISPRTGTHIHLDVSNCTSPQIHKKSILYALCEEPLFKWVGDNRHLNQFCLPWFNAPGDLHIINTALNSTNVYAAAMGINRYAALNLNAISKFGSVEFRHLKTTFDKQRIIDWIGIILCLKKKAMAYEGSCFDLLRDFSILGQEKFMETIFPSEILQLIPKEPINVGLLTAMDLLPRKGKGTLFNFLSFGENAGYKKYKEKRNA